MATTNVPALQNQHLFLLSVLFFFQLPVKQDAEYLNGSYLIYFLNAYILFAYQNIHNFSPPTLIIDTTFLSNYDNNMTWLTCYIQLVLIQFCWHLINEEPRIYLIPHNT